MIDKIGTSFPAGISKISAPKVEKPELAEAKPAEGGFGSELDKAIEGVRGALEGADEAAVKAMVGDGQPHTAMIAMTKADLALRFVTQTRNKALEAYREIMNLQV
jgi:flagellar hook-basal body complex protein FliE